MLSRRIRPGLCQYCRNDLFLLFENGLASSSACRRVPRPWVQWSSAPPSHRKGKAIRSFSSRHAVRSSIENPNSPTIAPSSNADVVAQLYRDQLEEIKDQPGTPKIGDLDIDGLKYTAERIEEIAHEIWSIENGGAFNSPEPAAKALAEKVKYSNDRWDQDKQDIESLKRDRDKSQGGTHQETDVLQGRTDSDDVEEAQEQDRDELVERAQQELDRLEVETGLDEVEDLREDHTQNEIDSCDPVQAMRDSEGSVEEVVREARQLHGEYLPEGVLSEDESKTYRRLYGDPVEKAEVDDDPPEIEEFQEVQVLLDQDGQSIHHAPSRHDHLREEQTSFPPSESMTSRVAKSMTERAMEVAESIGGEVRPYEMDEITEENATEKGHPLTVLGRFQTSPRTTFLPQESFVHPVQKILAEHSNKHVKEMSERVFGGPGLPDSPLTPRIGRTLPQKPIPLDASQHGLSLMEANAYVSIIWPSTYAAVSSVLVETRKRLGTSWLRNLITKEGGASVLDAGGGGVGIITWRDIITAEWNTLHSSDASPPPPPFGRSTVLTGADNLRYRAADLLENTTFLPRLPDYVHVRNSTTLADDRPAPQRKQFDVIIAPHTLWSLGEEWQRKQQVQNFWSLLNPDGGVLILIEKGVPRGFEVIAGAREFLLSRYIATAHSPTYESKLESSNEDRTVQKGKGMIIAPCTNHVPCPMYTVPGVSKGRKDYCSFQQRYIRPPFLQRILGAKDRNHDDVDFSYIAVQKGRDLQDAATADASVVQGKAAADSAFQGYEDVREPEDVEKINHLTLPRLIFPPLKRPGHVTIDVCTPAGSIDRWTISKSFSRAAYSDARKSSWGDLWALGAKTRVPRNLQLGGDLSKKGKSPKERMMSKARDILERVKEEKKVDREMEAEVKRAASEENDALLDDDDIDVDAAVIMREIEQEKRQRRAESSAQKQPVRQKRSAPFSELPELGAKTTSSLQRSKTVEYPPAQPIPTKLPDDSTTNPEAHQPNPTEPPPPPISDLTLPDLAATLADFSAESRFDALQNLSTARLSRRSDSAKLRIKRGENKFREPEKEAWRVKMERRKEKKREEKTERAERRESRLGMDEGRVAEGVARKRGRGKGRGGKEVEREGEPLPKRDSATDVWGFDE